MGIYLLTTRGEYVFTSFDTDDQSNSSSYAHAPGRALHQPLHAPRRFAQRRRYVLGVNASAFRIRRYFQDEHALAFNVDATGAPGMQWPEPRLGPVRPRLDWQIEAVSRASWM